jgi:hypothetical protein
LLKLRRALEILHTLVVLLLLVVVMVLLVLLVLLLMSKREWRCGIISWARGGF